jgi:ribosomal protein S18 acetylase RimI-like enzyme
MYALWRHTPNMGLNDIDDSREGIERYLRRNPCTSFVAELGGAVVGAILCGHDGRRGVIYHTTVALPHRRQGIGAALVGAALNALKAEGIVKVNLVAFHRNGEGNAFWERAGFSTRPDLVYRNKALAEIRRIDT